ncbi:MAG TPA: TonB-dependent receptor [Terriglobales bacterium]|nr:TonB-dependent receptor [Terriglobales bacterium]
MKRAILFVAFIYLISTAATTLAQVDTASVVGIIRDSSGAVLAGATATATNIDTGIKTAVKSGPDGNYVITPLKIGRYSVSVEAPGFRTEVRQNIVLDVQQSIKLDFNLQVGSVTETTSVVGETPLIETENASLGDVVAAQQVELLPLNGRRYTDLATLTTGVAKVIEGPVNGGSSPTNGNTGGSFAVNGTRGDQNNFILDGVDNNSNDNGDVAIISSVDAIAEFKVQTSNYSPEFGRSGGAVVNATTKSGTNQFHGSAWEFLRNEKLDARQYFESSTDPKAPYKQNQFGATIGGPVIKEKVFFFGDYEGTRISQAATTFETVPSVAETQGNFSDLLGAQTATCGPNGDQLCFDSFNHPIYDGEIFNPFSSPGVFLSPGSPRTAFGFDATGKPINIIPPQYLNSIGLNYAALYPAPNVPGAQGNNYVTNAPGHHRVDQMDIRMDENVSSKDQLFQRFTLVQDHRFQAPPFPGLADGGSYNTGNRPLHDRGLALGSTHTFSPTLINDLRYGFNRIYYISNSPSYGQKLPPPGLQIPGVPDNPLVNGLTLLQPAGYRRIGEPGFTPTTVISESFQLNDTVSIIHGKHMIKVGPQFRWDQFNMQQIAQPRGRMSFSGQYTAVDPLNQLNSGNGIADMLLGLPVTSVISTVIFFHNRQHTYGGFVQDSYKVLPNLTLDLGLRYDYASPVFDANHRQSNFDYTKGVIVPARTAGYPENLANTDKADFAPRIGFSYSPFQSRPFVIRAGYGRFFTFQEIRTGDPLQLAYNLPFFFEPTFQSDGLKQPQVTLATGFPPLDPSQVSNGGVTSQDWNPHTAVYDMWNLNLEYQLPGQIVISPAYVGTKGTHLQVLTDRNQIPTPSSSFDQNARPYPQFGPFTGITNRGNSTYHAFQLKAEKRTSHGLYFLSAYTFSKSINDQPEICCNSPWPQNSYNLAAEKGLSDFDNRNRWVNSFDYELPIGKGKRFLNEGGVVDKVVGGWHIGGIVTFRSGFPFSPIISFDPSNTGSQGLQRSNQIGSGHLSNRGPNLWFNINDFPVPSCPSGCFGNARKNVLTGPGEKGADLSARKFFALTEQVRLEFRAEFFNAFNHAVFIQPDNVIDDGPGAAGVITDTVIPQRQIQLALKLSF